MKPKYNIIVFLLLLTTPTLQSQNNTVPKETALVQSKLFDDPFIKLLTKGFFEHNEFSPTEKTYVHTNKDLISSGEDIWYSIYTVLGNEQHYSLLSKSIHVDLISPDNKVIISQVQKLDNGRGNGSIKIPTNSPAGLYTIRAYTDWMRNFDNIFFFRKTIKVLNEKTNFANKTETKEDIDLQFFPEGGNAVIGVTSKIAFKAIGTDGKGKPISGKVLNSKNEFITTTNTIHKGLGFFYLKPKANETYRVVLNNGTEYNINNIKSEGYVFSVNNTDQETVKVRVEASPNLKKRPFYVIGHLQNQKYFQGKFEFQGKSAVTFNIPRAIFPNGVATLTLFDQDKKPWSERVLFVGNKQELTISTKINRKRFKARDKIALDIHITDKKGMPISTDLSIAITDQEKFNKSTAASNILSYMLLESELKGHIEDPGMYFENQNKTTKSRLDLVMLTHGWRRFNWQETRMEFHKKPKKHPFSKGFTLSGLAKNLYDTPLKYKTLNVTAKTKHNSKVYPVVTNADGRFEINNISEADSITMDFGAFKPNGDPVDVKVVLDKNSGSRPSVNENLKKTPVFNGVKDEAYLELYKQEKEVDSLFNLENITILDKIVIKSKNKTKEPKSYSKPSTNGIRGDVVVYTEDKPNQTIFDLLVRVAGVRVTGSGNPPDVRIRGGVGNFSAETGPLWVFDGVPVDASAIAAIVGNDASRTIERIEVLKGPGVAAYGVRGAGGVILLYSREGRGSVGFNNKLTSKHIVSGYSGAKAFYVPKYDVKLPKHSKPDYRSTLYWNHNITTDANGDASVIFYNSDLAKKIQISIEALSKNGTPGAYLKSFGND